MPEWSPSLGAWPEGPGTRFRVWAPERSSVELVVEFHPASDGRDVAPSSARSGSATSAFAQIDHANVASGFGRTAITDIHRSVERGGAIGTVALGGEHGRAMARELRSLERDARGYWSGWFADLRPGTLYRFRIDRDDGQIFPDPASRYQPQGVHGPSQVIDPTTFRWTDDDWRPPLLESIVFYELHVGTFSPSGSFDGAMEKLSYLAQLGVSAIELMPVADFPGRRNWGYDGVALFAPARCYDTPDDLRRFVDAAHRHGLAVFLDVVYNHLGPDGAYASVFSPHYFTDRHRSPWGKGVNLDGPHSSEVRGFFIENALHWVNEYHVDGLRVDATHAMQDESATPFIAELAATVRERSRGPVIVVAEDPRNLACLLIDRGKGGWGLDAAWADDFHHQVRVHVAHDHEGYYRDFTGTTADIATTVRQGWFFTGQHSTHTGGSRGTDPFAVAPPQFVICIQNHDQIGNRADGARLNHEIDAATFRAASTLLLLAPQTPLIFMGQEWACASPFQFFTDHNQELGRLITIGRREEFRCFATFTDPGPVYVPDPQAEETFIRSRLSWSELHTEPHASMLRLYQRLLALRATSPALGTTSRDAYDARALDGETVLIVRHTPDHRERIATVVRLGGGGLVVFDDARAHWQVFLTTEDHDVAPDAMPIEVTASDAIDIRFHRPGAVVLRGHPES